MIQATFASIHSCLHMCLLVSLEMAIKKEEASSQPTLCGLAELQIANISIFLCRRLRGLNRLNSV